MFYIHWWWWIFFYRILFLLQLKLLVKHLPYTISCVTIEERVFRYLICNLFFVVAKYVFWLLEIFLILLSSHCFLWFVYFLHFNFLERKSKLLDLISCLTLDFVMRVKEFKQKWYSEVMKSSMGSRHSIQNHKIEKFPYRTSFRPFKARPPKQKFYCMIFDAMTRTLLFKRWNYLLLTSFTTTNYRKTCTA